MKPLLLENLTWPEVKKAVKAGVRTALFPLGSTEEHGFHLPLSTDMVIAYEVAVRAASKVKALVVPPLPFGVCRTTAPFPGTLTISLETLQRIVEEVCLSLHSHGVRNIVLVPGHLGSAQLVGLELAAQRLVRLNPDLHMAIVRFPEVLRRQLAEGFIEDAEDLHAGEVETSLMLVLKPKLVKAELAQGAVGDDGLRTQVADLLGRHGSCAARGIRRGVRNGLKRTRLGVDREKIRATAETEIHGVVEGFPHGCNHHFHELSSLLSGNVHRANGGPPLPDC